MALVETDIALVDARDLSYSQVACVAILTWDVLITLSEEVCASVLRSCPIADNIVGRTHMAVSFDILLALLRRDHEDRAMIA